MSDLEALCTADREMMLEFSARCMNRLNNHLPLRLLLAPFQPFLDANVLKEIEKNQLIIKHAAVAFKGNMDSAGINIDSLFEMTKKIDEQFLRKLSHPFFSLEIRYDDFAEIRKKRIASFITMSFNLLNNWDDRSSFPEIVRKTFSETRYREVLGEVLHLYNVETRMLSCSSTLTGPAGRAKDFCAEKLFATMENTAREIAIAYARNIFMEQSGTFVNRS